MVRAHVLSRDGRMGRSAWMRESLDAQEQLSSHGVRGPIRDATHRQHWTARR